MSTQPRRPWWREPLVHFLIGGAVIWGFRRVQEPAETGTSPERVIVLSQAFTEGLARQEEARTGHRPRNAVERGAMISRYLRDEVLYREALALGLDRGDIIVRRRLVQKMEFLLRDAELPEPSQQDLEAFLERHADDFRLEPTYAFEHRFFSGESGTRVAQAALDAFRASQTELPTEPFILGLEQPLRTKRTIAGQFGDAFAASVESAPLGEWTGPVESSFGAHLVRVTQSTSERAASLSDARAQVERAWREQARNHAFEAAMQRLIETYRIEREDE